MRLNFYDINEQSTTTPILILHGLFGASQNWQTFARQLSRSDFRVISVDLRNHGRSFHHKIHTYEEMAFDLLCLIKENLTEPVNILGHSMGGKVAMLFSSLFPEYVNKLAIIDIALANKERDIPEYLQVDEKKRTIKFVRTPKFEEVPYPVVMEPNLVIEYYSR